MIFSRPFPAVPSLCLGIWAGLALLLCRMGALQGLVVITAFSLPGLALLGFTNPLTRPVATAIHASVGIAMSLLVLLGAGLTYGRLSPGLTIATIGFLALVCLLVPRTKGGSTNNIHAGSADPAWLTIILIAGMLLLPLTGADAMTTEEPSYRPFFNADFFKHLAIAQTIAIGNIPPIDPFGASGSLRYYWLQHLIPATGLQWFPGTDPFQLMIAIGLVQTILLTVLLFGMAERASGSPQAALIAVFLGISGLSLDGLAAVLDNPSLHWIDIASNVNQEALDLTTPIGAPYHIAATTLFRLCLYLPQHQLCAAFFLACMLIGLDSSTQRTLLARAALILTMPALSLLLGIPSVVSLLLIALSVRPQMQVAATVLLLLGLSLFIPLATGMLDLGHVQHIASETWDTAKEASLLNRLIWFPPQLLTSIGVILLVGCWVFFLPNAIRIDIKILALPLALSLAGYIFAETFLHAGRLRLDLELKLSLLACLALVPLTAVWIESASSGQIRTWQAVGPAILAIVGSISLFHDLWWHSRFAADLDTSGMTITIPSADMAAQRWIKSHLPPNAVIQQYPESPFLISGGRDTWIPVFAGRRIAASQRGTNTTPEQLSNARKLFDPIAPHEVSRKALLLGAEYLYLSRSLTPEGYRRIRQAWDEDRQLRRIYELDGVSVWQVSAL